MIFLNWFRLPNRSFFDLSGIKKKQYFKKNLTGSENLLDIKKETIFQKET